MQGIQKNKVVYLIGSLKNPNIPIIANKIREAGFEVFADWWCASDDADDTWKMYEQGQGHSYLEALNGYMAKHVFEFDKSHLERCDIAVLVLPAGKSGHLELGWSIGKGKKGYILLEEGTDPRWDCMYLFADGVFETINQLIIGMQYDD